MKTLVQLGVVLVLLTGIACAEETKPLVVGPGTISCSKFNAISSSQIVEVTTWAQGFLSGMNSYRWLSTRYQPLVLPDMDTIQERLKVYCTGHPFDTALKGTLLLFEELEDR